VADLLEQGAAWLATQRQRHTARPVTYVRDAATVELLATPGRTTFEQVSEFGVVTRIEAHDWLIAAADLVLDGQCVLPQAGDRIRESANGQVQVYEVLAPGGEPPYRYSEVSRHTLRIHTKRVDTEAL
jgi:hypothetical protein